jgi:N-methylhydantoinase A/oxoprolinase/acetone carboxylase beta subunit
MKPHCSSEGKEWDCKAMPWALGIDTGGTYTDAVVVDTDSGQVLASAKAPTTRHRLTVGIAEALQRLRSPHLSAVKLVSLSTTLATNAVVEGKGVRVGAILIGYNQRFLESSGLVEQIPAWQVRFIAGGHDLQGQEQAPLDRAAAERAVAEMESEVEAFAVSGYFSVLNPAHEIEVRELVRARTCRPVVCGHELTSQLNALKRAATAALNASLIPLTLELMEATRTVLAQHGIAAPLTVVRGDGSLMTEAMARERPIETILSGPAASAVGGQALARVERAVVVDMGGTTTDIALLQNGRPRSDPRGAAVGRWRTCVQAADIWTAGLGGDSQLSFQPKDQRLQVGPRRVVPLCMAAAEHPEVRTELARLKATEATSSLVNVTDFLLFSRRPPETLALKETERRALELLERAPRSVLQLTRDLNALHPRFLGLERLEEPGFVVRAGLTPTDLLHAQGVYTAWDVEAARLGVEVFARSIGWPPEVLVERGLAAVTEGLALQILGKLTGDSLYPQPFPHCEVCSVLAQVALNGHDPQSLLDCELKVQVPIVGIGAPAATFLPAVGEKLRAPVIIPPHAEVANAIGAVSGSVTLELEARILPIHSVAGIHGYRLHSAGEPEEFLHLEDAVAAAERHLRQRVAERAAAAGAEFHVRIERDDRRVAVRTEQGEQPEALLLETLLRAHAVGRPRVAEEG